MKYNIPRIEHQQFSPVSFLIKQPLNQTKILALHNHWLI